MIYREQGWPTGNLVLDSPGDLYGSTWADGAYGQGSLFKLSPTSNGWIYTRIHGFNGSPNVTNASRATAIDMIGVIDGASNEARVRPVLVGGLCTRSRRRYC